jgi:hypothetical protein
MTNKKDNEESKATKRADEDSANNIKCWDCNENATERLKQMFVDLIQKKRIARGSVPARRAVFRKQHGIVYGEFKINKDIPDKFKLGIFSGDAYECALRFSSDAKPTGSDLKTTIGLGMKLFGVDGTKLFGEGVTSDFIFQNIDRFFAKDADQMCAFTTAGVIDGDSDAYLEKNPEVAAVLDDMKKVEASCLTAGYWSILPFKLGTKNIVKYRLVPDSTDGGAPFNSDDYLSLDLQRRLLNGSVKFRFEIQLRTNDDMQIDNARDVWSEEDSPYICIAELRLPQQDICAIGQENFGENLSFNIWRTLAEHEPLGSIAQARKVVYKASADTRHQANGQLCQEPIAINPAFVEDKDGDCIVYAGIYPPIGVMRVGNSKKGYFIGPEVNNPFPVCDKAGEQETYRDSKGALKRQAAKFRIYGFNAAGKAIKELTLDNADIEWHAHLANQKSSWYEFQIALDIPESADAPPSMLRNNNVADRIKLLIDGGKHSLKGTSNTGEQHQFKGKFMDEDVYLGEMRTDEVGRLLMLGGHGKSKNVNGDIAITFANNEGWYDDMSDGPISAKVKYNGNELKVLPAWIVCAPPDYAPLQKSVRTMWDLMRDVSVSAVTLSRPIRPSFAKDILPIFERMTNLQWVNAGFAGAFGWGGQFDYTSNEWIAKLGNPSPAFFELRKTISNNFRRYSVDGAQAPQLWPWVYGDAMSTPASGSVRQYATLSNLQLSFLDQWVKGDFDADHGDQPIVPVSINDLPVEEQPDMLTKASMESCLADAFHPGCEMTWPMRIEGMYQEPFRLLHASNTEPTNGHYYGPSMNSDVITLPRGPLTGGQVAGGITRWMAIPWQCDTASCRDGYDANYDPYVPTFWPARVPNNILSESMYGKAVDGNLSKQERAQSFTYREAWLDDLPIEEPVTYTKQINSMITNFDKLAVVLERPGVKGDVNFPTKMQVGITPQNDPKSPVIHAKIKSLKDGPSMHGELHNRRVNLSNIEKAQRFGRKKKVE